MKNALRLGVVSVCLGTIGCAGWGSYLDPQPTPAGRSEVSVQLEGAATRRGTGYFVLPNVALGFRRGLGDGWDLGGRVSALGLAGDMRIALRRAGSFVVSLVPQAGVSWVPLTNDDEGTVRVDVRAGAVAAWRMSQTFSLLFGVRPALLVTGPNIVFRGRFDAVRSFFLLGGQVGLRARLTETLALVVEVGADPQFDLGSGEWRRPPLHGGAALWFSGP